MAALVAALVALAAGAEAAAVAGSAARSSAARLPLDAVQLLQARAVSEPASGASALGLGDAGHAGMAAENVERREQQRSEPTRKARVLLFFAVSGNPDSMFLVKRNIEHAREAEASSGGMLKFDVGLAHYDGKSGNWKASVTDKLWYTANVQRSWEDFRGVKFTLAKQAVVADQAWASGYDWLWILDEDADFHSMDLARTVADAEASGSVILTPAIVSRNLTKAPNLLRERGSLGTGCQPGDEICAFQAPREDCRFRYVSFVEVSFPLVRPRAFLALASGCQNCFKTTTIWGLDHIWCKFAASVYSMSKRAACAILDRNVITHMNFQTLPKWTGSSKGEPGHRNSDWRSMQQVHAELPQFWEWAPYNVSECVRE